MFVISADRINILANIYVCLMTAVSTKLRTAI